MSSRSCEKLPRSLSSLGGVGSDVSCSCSTVEHVSILSENLTNTLFLNSEYADVYLTVEGVRIPAHRIILAARSQYFRALLYGGLRETKESEIELKGTPILAFKALLKYIYSGRMFLNELKEETTLDVLGLSHQWGFEQLEASICEFLKSSLSVNNVCAVMDAGLIFGLESLVNTCAVFADRNAATLLDHGSFMTMSSLGVTELISRDSFCAPEEKIFDVTCEWVRRNKDSTPNACSVLSNVRLSLMNVATLLSVVRPTGLVNSDAILDAIDNQSNTPECDIRYRGYLVPEENVATIQKGATVIKGDIRQTVIDGDTQNYDIERGFTRHNIDEPGDGGIILKLGQQCIINYVRLLLWDKDLRSYSYYIDVSMDQNEWIRVCDYSKYHCRSWQNIFFPQRVVRYIKIVGTHNTVNRVFHVVAVEAYFTRQEFTIDPRWGLWVPKENVATVELSASVAEGVSRNRNALINGETRGYDWDSGYTCHQLGSGAIVVQLCQPYVISSMRLLLWDLDDRYYSFYIEVSSNQRNWEMVANKSRERCKSWQTLRFSPIPVVFIRIVGTDNSANEVFHCVHFECPSQVDDPETSITKPQDDTSGVSNSSVSGLGVGIRRSSSTRSILLGRAAADEVPALDFVDDDEDVGIEQDAKSEGDGLD